MDRAPQVSPSEDRFVRCLGHPPSIAQRQTCKREESAKEEGSEDDLPQLVAALVDGGHLGRRRHRRPSRDLRLRRQGQKIEDKASWPDFVFDTGSREKFQDYLCREGERLRQQDRAAMGRN
ncbi:hypothetical protein EJB05_46602 [Eragrostis curvula]|uniref:Uncharacterized protein n=1 Tax=Eragrostis curvula TaxID=38414 RepID=A0A5J9TNT0_9POAL|nr:hypothetical protein EJB05_46602 [Eragrostis curvula]